MRNRAFDSVLAYLLIVAPLPILLFANLKRFVHGKGFEPLIDNVLTYVALFFIFSSAALFLSSFWYRHTIAQAFKSDRLAYVVGGALPPTVLMILLDWLDDYFSGHGISWAWPLMGLIMGGLFGALLGFLVDGRIQTSSD